MLQQSIIQTKQIMIHNFLNLILLNGTCTLTMKAAAVSERFGQAEYAIQETGFAPAIC